MKKLFNSFFSDVKELFFPKTCLGCNSVLETGNSLVCLTCEFSLEPYYIKNRELIHYEIKNSFSLFKFKENNPIEQLIYQLKYFGKKEVANYFALHFAQSFKELKWLSTIEAIIAVPLHPKRESKRGYNQSLLIAREIALILNIPLVENYLIRKRNTPSLAKSKTKDRWSVVKDAFSLNKEKKVKYNKWLLVDDVITSGSTLLACVQTLKKNSNTEISIISACTVD